MTEESTEAAAGDAMESSDYTQQGVEQTAMEAQDCKEPLYQRSASDAEMMGLLMMEEEVEDTGGDDDMDVTRDAELTNGAESPSLLPPAMNPEDYVKSALNFNDENVLDNAYKVMRERKRKEGRKEGNLPISRPSLTALPSLPLSTMIMSLLDSFPLHRRHTIYFPSNGFYLPFRFVSAAICAGESDPAGPRLVRCLRD